MSDLQTCPSHRDLIKHILFGKDERFRRERNAIKLFAVGFVINYLLLAYWILPMLNYEIFKLVEPYILHISLSISMIAASLWHIRKFGVKMACMPGMMVGMTIGMMSGFWIGYLVGATNGMLIGSITGTAVGIGLGYWCGKACGTMGILEGLMGGLMAGTMGPMLSVMLLKDATVFMPILSVIASVVLGGLSIMLVEEHWDEPVNSSHDNLDIGLFIIWGIVGSMAVVYAMVL